MRHIGPWSLVFAFVAWLNGSRAEVARHDLDALQGKWAMRSLTLNGEVFPPSLVAGSSLEIRGNECRESVAGRTSVLALTVGAEGVRSSADFTPAGRPGAPVLGRYRIEGDTLTVCRPIGPDQPRPLGERAGPGSGLMTAVWTRVPDHEAGELSDGEELAKLQGTWQLVSAETGGEKTPEERVKKIKVVISGNMHTVWFEDKVVAEGVSFTIDPTASPKQVTDTITEGPDKGKQVLGIYKVEGDRLTSCVAPLGSKDRPKEFKAGAGSPNTLRVFRRLQTS